MTLMLPAFSDSLTYGAEWLRYLAETTGLQEGVLAGGDLKVTAAVAGGMRVDVAAGTALIKGDSGTPGTGVSQGLFIAVNSAAIPNAVTLPASNGTNPRIDQIALRVRDAADLGTGADDLSLVYLSGSATAGATLDNRNGAASLPADHLRLADVLVPAGSSAVTAGNVRDRRPWARGAYWRGNYTGGNITVVNSLVNFAVSSPNLAPRLELSGAPLTMTVRASVQVGGGASVTLYPTLDGSIVDAISGAGVHQTYSASTVGTGVSHQWDTTPAAGSRVASWAHLASINGQTIVASAAAPIQVTFREDIRSNANNN